MVWADSSRRFVGFRASAPAVVVSHSPSGSLEPLSPARWALPRIGQASKQVGGQAYRLHGELLVKLLVKLAAIFKVSTDEILGLEESRPARAPRDRRDRHSKRDRDALMRALDGFLAKAQPG